MGQSSGTLDGTDISRVGPLISRKTSIESRRSTSANQWPTVHLPCSGGFGTFQWENIQLTGGNGTESAHRWSLQWPRRWERAQSMDGSIRNRLSAMATSLLLSIIMLFVCQKPAGVKRTCRSGRRKLPSNRMLLAASQFLFSKRNAPYKLGSTFNNEQLWSGRSLMLIFAKCLLKN